MHKPLVKFGKIKTGREWRELRVQIPSYVRKSLTSSTVSSPVVSRVRSAQLRGESSGVSRSGEDRELGSSSVWPVWERERERSTEVWDYVCSYMSNVVGVTSRNSKWLNCLTRVNKKNIACAWAVINVLSSVLESALVSITTIISSKEREGKKLKWKKKCVF